MVDRNLVEQVAGALATGEGLVEKDWHLVRAIAVIASLGQEEATAVFSGGTSLSKGWGLIKRFSEDIDFKDEMPTAESGAVGRKKRRAYRERVVTALEGSDFKLVGDPLVGNEGRFFSASFAYPSLFTPGQGLRPHIRVEMSFHSPARPMLVRSSSMISASLKTCSLSSI